MIIAYVQVVRRQTTVLALRVVGIVYWWWHPTEMHCARPVVSKGKLLVHRVTILCQQVEAMSVSLATGHEHAASGPPLVKPVSPPKRYVRHLGSLVNG